MIWRSLAATWQVLAVMAPYLLLGFAVAGVLAVLLTADWVRRHMGRPGLWQVIKAALIGVPLPLCSCSVIPVAFSLRRHGASKAATASFLAATPQTGIDSLAPTYSVLGPVVMCFRVAAAFVSGVLAGLLVAAASRRDPPETLAEAPEEDANSDAPTPAWRRALRHAAVTLPRDMAGPLLLGMLVTGVLTVCVPPGFLSGRLPPGLVSYLVALAVGVPLYVCSTASIPLAASFIHMGASPGAAMVFLISGPATNAASLAVMWARLGRLATIGYLVAIAATALLAGWAIDRFFPGVTAAVPPLDAACTACASHGWSVLPALLLLALLVPGLLPESITSRRSRPAP